MCSTLSDLNSGRRNWRRENVSSPKSKKGDYRIQKSLLLGRVASSCTGRAPNKKNNPNPKSRHHCISQKANECLYRLPLALLERVAGVNKALYQMCRVKEEDGGPDLLWRRKLFRWGAIFGPYPGCELSEEGRVATKQGQGYRTTLGARALGLGSGPVCFEIEVLSKGAYVAIGLAAEKLKIGSGQSAAYNKGPLDEGIVYSCDGKLIHRGVTEHFGEMYGSGDTIGVFYLPGKHQTDRGFISFFCNNEIQSIKSGKRAGLRQIPVAGMWVRTAVDMGYNETAVRCMAREPINEPFQSLWKTECGKPGPLPGVLTASGYGHRGLAIRPDGTTSEGGYHSRFKHNPAHAVALPMAPPYAPPVDPNASKRKVTSQQKKDSDALMKLLRIVEQKEKK